MDIKIRENLLQLTIELGNLWKRQDQIIHKKIIVDLVFLKSGQKLDKIYWKSHSWKQLSLIGNETVINHQRTKVNVFSDFVLCLGRVLQHPNSNKAWKTELQESDPRKATKILMLSTENRLNSNGTSFQDPQRCSSVTKSAIF